MYKCGLISSCVNSLTVCLLLVFGPLWVATSLLYMEWQKDLDPKKISHASLFGFGRAQKIE